MLRYGLIVELGVNENLGFARVFFDELEIKSGWLSLPTTGTKEIKDWKTFPEGTQVAVLMHRDGEQGEIIGSTWSETDAPPDFASKNTRGISFPDGTKVVYDWNLHKLFVSSTNENMEIEITCKKLKVNGEIEATQQISAMTMTPTTTVTLSGHTHTANNTPPTPGT